MAVNVVTLLEYPVAHIHILPASFVAVRGVLFVYEVIILRLETIDSLSAWDIAIPSIISIYAWRQLALKAMRGIEPKTIRL